MKHARLHVGISFWIAPAIGLLLVAYFHACTVNALFRAALLSNAPALPRARDNVAPLASHASGDAILARNPFDSATGPLDREPALVEPAHSPPRVDPLRAPRCDGVRVVATTQSPDPLDSVAVVQGPSEPRGFVRRVGDDVGQRRIAFIGRNPLEWSPAVWLLAADGLLCQTLLFDQAPEVTQPPPAPARAAPPAPGPARPSPALTAAIASKIAQVGPSTFRIERSAVETILEQATKLLRSTKIRPAQQDGTVVGFELQRVAPGTLLDVLGLKNGDLLRSINGFELNGPAQALQAYARLRTADNIRVKAVRSGVPIELEYRIQ